MFFSIGTVPYWHQWQAALSLSLGAVATGTTRGWVSPYIAQLTAPNCTHPLKLTSTEASWIASLVYLGKFFGAALGAIIQDFIGRKKTLLWMSVPLAVGWGSVIIAPTVSWLYASRVLTGLAEGMIYSASASFLGEIADPMIRGSLIIFNGNAISFGALLGTIMGGLLPMEIFSCVCLVLTGFFAATFVFVPESPYHHIANGEINQAEESLKWFKHDADVKREIRELQDFVGTSSVSFAKRFEELKKWKHQKNFIIVICITVFLYSAGLTVTHSYAEIILTMSKVDLTASVVVMGLSFSEIVAGTIALVLVDKFGRKPLLMGSGLGLGIGQILLGYHFHVLSTVNDDESNNFLPVFALFLIYFSIPCGLSSVGDTLLGELFPPMLKTPASFAFAASSALISFAVSKSFQPYRELVGEKYVFWTFAMSALFSVVFSYFCIPATTGISLIDIQENLTKSSDENVVTNVDEKTNIPIIDPRRMSRV